MERCICNRCFASVNRGKKPFYLTDCGHVYCQRCIEQVRDKCLQCNMTGIRSLVLEKPLLPQIAHFFSSTNDVLMKLQRTHAFQTRQSNILARRFMELDAKYEVLKLRYVKAAQEYKRFVEVNKNLKLENENLEKRLMSLRLCSGSTTSNLTTPDTLASNRSWFIPNSHSNTSETTGDFITPTQRFNPDKDRTSSDYRRPHHKLLRPSDFFPGFSSDGSAFSRK